MQLLLILTKNAAIASHREWPDYVFRGNSLARKTLKGKLQGKRTQRNLQNNDTWLDHVRTVRDQLQLTKSIPRKVSSTANCTCQWIQTTEGQASTLYQWFVFRTTYVTFSGETPPYVRFMAVINAIDRLCHISLCAAATRDYTRNFIGVITTADGWSLSSRLLPLDAFDDDQHCTMRIWR